VRRSRPDGSASRFNRYASKRTLFEAFDLRIIYDKASDRLSISATLTRAVPAMLRCGLEPLRLSKDHSGGGARTHNLSINSRALGQSSCPGSRPGF